MPFSFRALHFWFWPSILRHPHRLPGRTLVFRPLKYDLSPALSSLPVSLDVGEEDKETEGVHAPLPIGKRDPRLRRGLAFDAVAQTAPVISLLGPPTVSFEGVAQRNGSLPPDVNGDVGPNHYVQWINLSMAVFDKAGAILAGPMNGNTLFAGFTGPGSVCATTNSGDPIVLYDHLADRWFLTQFALPNFPNGPFYQCIAVSQTSNPAGAYHRYVYLVPEDERLPEVRRLARWLLHGHQPVHRGLADLGGSRYCRIRARQNAGGSIGAHALHRQGR